MRGSPKHELERLVEKSHNGQSSIASNLKTYIPFRALRAICERVFNILVVAETASLADTCIGKQLCSLGFLVSMFNQHRSYGFRYTGAC